MALDRRAVRCLCAAAALAGLGGHASAQADATVGGPDARMICGARTADFVLAWYGRPQEAIDLVQELQGARPNRPVGVAAVAAAIENHGVRAQVVRAPTPGVVDWNGPVIYHTVTSSGVGHFFVRSPARGRFPALYWCNTRGFSATIPDEYAAGLSGVMVLTSEPGSEGGELPQTSAAGLRIGWKIWCAAGAAAAGAAALVYLRGRSARGVSS